MIFITRRSVDSQGVETPKANTIVVTISEKLKSSATNLLFVFESDQQHTISKTVLESGSSFVTLGERTDSIRITEGGASTETLTGTLKISPAGFYYYKIYQQNNKTNLDVNDSSVVALLEQGKLTVLDTDELTTTEHTNTVDNFIHINS